MASAASTVAMLALCASIAAVVGFSSSIHQLGASTTTAQAVQDLLPLASMVALLAAVASIYRQLHHHAGAAAGGAGTDVAAGAVCAAVGFIQLFPHDHVMQPRAVGAAAVHVLPATATVTFFLGVALVYVHGGGAIAAGDGPVQTPVRILTKVTLGAAAAVVGLMALAAGAV